MKPGPAISTLATSSLAGNAATSAWASARGLLRAGLASSIAALVAKSPCSRVLGRSTTKSGGRVSAGRVPLARKASMPWPISARSWAFTWDLLGTKPPILPDRAPRVRQTVQVTAALSFQPAALGQRHRAAVADHEVVEQADLHQIQCLQQTFGDRAVGLGGLRVAGRMVVPDDHGRCIVQ